MYSNSYLFNTRTRTRTHEHTPLVYQICVLTLMFSSVFVLFVYDCKCCVITLMVHRCWSSLVSSLKCCVCSFVKFVCVVYTLIRCVVLYSNSNYSARARTQTHTVTSFTSTEDTSFIPCSQFKHAVKMSVKHMSYFC